MILIGIIAALVLRIVFALVVTQLMQIVGLILAGGLLLLWVAWKMYRELRHAGESGGSDEVDGDEHRGLRPAKSFAGAAWAVALADVSMSLDNVLAVAGAAREHPGILIIGLILSVALMGLAANFIAKYIERYRWIAWIGLVVIVWVAGKMIYDGVVDHEVGVLRYIWPEASSTRPLGSGTGCQAPAVRSEKALADMLREEGLGAAVGQPRRFLAAALAHLGGEAVVLAGIIVDRDPRMVVQALVDRLLLLFGRRNGRRRRCGASAAGRWRASRRAARRGRRHNSRRWRRCRSGPRS